MKKTITLFLFFLSLQNYAQCWQTISSGPNHTIALRTDGTLWAWGDNSSGQLGDGTLINKNQPVQIGTANNWQKISAGINFSLAIKTNGTLWAWGSNLWGRLGITVSGRQLNPIQIGTATDWRNISASAGTSGGHSLAIKSDGTLWAWGSNSYGQLGDNTVVNKNQAVQIGVDTDWLTIDAGGDHSVAIKTNGTLWAWGSNGSRQLGTGINGDRHTPTQIGTDTNWQSIDGSFNHTLGIRTDGTLWAWGSGAAMGLGATIGSTNVLLQVGTDNDWAKVIGGINHSLALKTNGTLWSWGENASGGLGLGTDSASEIRIPTQVSTNADKTIISAGNDFSQIMNSDGYLYAAGLNTAGQLGDGTNVNKNTLTSVSCAFLSTNQFEALQIDTYPNPVRNQLHLSSPEEIIMISIYNLLGQEIANKYIQSKETSVDLSALSSGTYLIKATSANNVKKFKIVKQ
ncbi:T9SS type A sorting domain-containing protein [uncultured Flavobacterium sp.]|uniref:RCC1 domain-containing protein n=1 Tax=uncultured Flavobacterium sp. TaxID=165435 RepID=UPI0025EA0741|nr:T9SS type A sorting domain-containing protein [uncultured Flavobacterium sp.]